MAYAGGASVYILQFINLAETREEICDAWEDVELDLFTERMIRAVPDWTEKESN